VPTPDTHRGWTSTAPHGQPLALVPFQERAVEATIRVLRGNLTNRAILVSPTGSGKTVMAVDLTSRLAVPTLWLTHRKELVEQAAAHLERLGGMVGIIKAGVPPAPLAPIQVASVQTLVRREMPADVGLVVIDEAHHATADTYREILDAYPQALRLGLTATPFRLDGHGLGDLFDEIVVAAYPDELCAEGWLHAPRVWASHSPDLRGIRVIAGDYNLATLGERSNRPELIGDIVETWRRRAAGRRTVCFAVDIEHSRTIMAAFVAAGIPAEHLDGSTKVQEREDILARLASGETHVVSNCQVLTEGWDLPALECAIVARPTASLNLHLQMLGRIMRVCDGKAGAIVLDHAGNHHVHGLVTRRLTYSILPGSKVGSDEPLNLRRCKACGLYFDPARYACPECGWQPVAAEHRRPDAKPGELGEFDDSTFEYRREIWRLLDAEREAAGFADGWTAVKYHERFGEWPVVAGGDLLDATKAGQAEKREVYESLVAVAARKGFKRGWASYRYRDIFGVWPMGFVGAGKANSIREKFGLPRVAATEGEAAGDGATDDDSPF